MISLLLNSVGLILETKAANMFMCVLVVSLFLRDKSLEYYRHFFLPLGAPAIYVGTKSILYFCS